MERLKSRKFWMALLGAILPVLNEQLGLKIPVESVLVVIAYILGQSYVDAKR